MNAKGTQLSRLRRLVPVDIIAILGILALTYVFVFLPVLTDSPFRSVVGLVFVLFVPGYALVAALFPEASRHPSRTSTENRDFDISNRSVSRRDRGIDGIERVALAFALSLAVVPLLGMAVTLSPLAFDFGTVFAALTLFVLLCAVVTTVRRWRLPTEKRFHVPVQAWFGRLRTSLTEGSRSTSVLNVGLAIVIIIAVGSLGFAALSPPDGERYTGFQLLTADNDGELVAAEYPETLSPEETEQVYVGIENNEREVTEYEVVVQLQRLDSSTDSTSVTDRVELDRFSMTLEDGERERVPRELAAPETITGDDLRVVFLLYDGSVPDTPTTENAYRSLHIWVDVPDGTEDSPTETAGE